MDICLTGSLKVIGTDTDRSATYDFILVFHSNYSPISYGFRDKWRYLQNFPIPFVSNAPGEGFPWNFVKWWGEKKTRKMPHQNVKKFHSF